MNDRKRWTGLMSISFSLAACFFLLTLVEMWSGSTMGTLFFGTLFGATIISGGIALKNYFDAVHQDYLDELEKVREDIEFENASTKPIPRSVLLEVLRPKSV